MPRPACPPTRGEASLDLTGTADDERHRLRPAPRPHGPQHDPRMWLAVAAGGALGGLLRALLEDRWPAEGGWPWITFAVNLGGAALLGWAAIRLQERLAPSTYRRPFLGTGLCGGLTTFSTLQVEVVRLADDGRVGLAVAYGAASLAGGLAVMFTVARLVRRARWRA